MNHRAGLAALACCLTACSSKHEAPSPPDTTPPAIANEVNRGVYFTDPVRVVFTEPIALTGGTAVTVESALLQREVPATVTLRSSGVIEVAPEIGLQSDDTLTVTVRNVADTSGNALVRGTARFDLTAWQEVGGGPATPAPIPGFAMPRLALDGGVPVVAWIQGMSRLPGSTWEVSQVPYFEQQLATVAGAGPLRTLAAGDAIVLEQLSGASPTRLLAVPSTLSNWAIAAGRSTPSGTDAVMSWQRTEGGATRVHVARNGAGSADVLLPLDAGSTNLLNRAAAMSPSGVAYVAVDDSGSSLTAPRARVYASGPGDSVFRSIGPDVDSAFVGDLAVDAAGVLYLATNEVSGLQVRSWDGTTWRGLGAIPVAAWGTLAIDPDGAPLVAFTSGGSTARTIRVQRWNGTSWVTLADPIQANSQYVGDPRLAVDPSGNVYVAYEEWTGEGPPPFLSSDSSFLVRVRKLSRFVFPAP